MAVNKTAKDLIGSHAALETIGAGATAVSSASNISTAVGVLITTLVTYGANIPASDPLVEVLTSIDGTHFDTSAFESILIPRNAESTNQVSFPIRFAEAVKYYKVVVTNGGTNAADFWVSAVETTL